MWMRAPLYPYLQSADQVALRVPRCQSTFLGQLRTSMFLSILSAVLQRLDSSWRHEPFAVHQTIVNLAAGHPMLPDQIWQEKEREKHSRAVNGNKEVPLYMHPLWTPALPAWSNPKESLVTSPLLKGWNMLELTRFKHIWTAIGTSKPLISADASRKDCRQPGFWRPPSAAPFLEVALPRLQQFIAKSLVSLRERIWGRKKEFPAFGDSFWPAVSSHNGFGLQTPQGGGVLSWATLLGAKWKGSVD